MKGIPILHNELKKTRGLDLTDTAWEAISTAAKTQGLSKSEFVEQWARKLDAALKVAELNGATIEYVDSLIKCDRQEPI